MFPGGFARAENGKALSRGRDARRRRAMTHERPGAAGFRFVARCRRLVESRQLWSGRCVFKGMRFLLAALALLALSAPPAQAESRAAAFRARARLGPDVAARVIRITAAPAANGRPAEFHGLVVAFADILWLYTEADGTQNLSLRRGQLAEDEANLLGLLRQAIPGVTGFADDTDPAPARANPAGPLPNGCFIACVAHWEKLRRERDPPGRVRLLACYPPSRGSGHMVLEFWRRERCYVFDPDEPGTLRRLPAREGEDPLAVAAAALEGRWRTKPVKAIAVEWPLHPEPGTKVAGEPAAPPPRT